MMLELWKETLHKAFGALITDLSKTFDYLRNDIFIVKQHEYGVELPSLSSKKWSNTSKQFVAKLLTNCLSVFDHFVGLALKVLKLLQNNLSYLQQRRKMDPEFCLWKKLLHVSHRVLF